MTLDQNVGGYGPLILAQDFDEQTINAAEALNSIVGVGYTPLAVQKQVVAGVNYAFFCKAQPVYPNAEAFLARATVFASLPDSEGKIHYSITQIERIAP
ncbi:hypothetical protein [Vibrio nigripulchritudo]|uniref:hypothetical protein n=1 Tax=Vibrio nigripulchritudo TaxID=28173 RepID=UPI0005F9F716|nr:hypothetical protein [Vibrio nigripulchritudo]KJY69773.1 hypothetical protein TW74_24045 [Vibrio nigripulchritudo]